MEINWLVYACISGVWSEYGWMDGWMGARPMVVSQVLTTLRNNIFDNCKTCVFLLSCLFVVLGGFLVEYSNVRLTFSTI